MAKLLVTGASGGIGRHLCQQLSSEHEVLPLSRNPATDSAMAPCDLARELPQLRGSAGRGNAGDIDWIIHLATSYRVEDDLAMLDNLIKFADENGIDNFLFVSSWVVHFPRRPIGAGYIEMKRRCEQRLLDSDISHARILRPSVVVGPELSWTKILQRLAPIANFIPPGFSRSFVTFDEVCTSIEKIINGKTHSKVITCLGQRQPLAEKAREFRTPTGRLIGASLVALLVLLVFASIAVSSLRPTPMIIATLLGGAFALAAVWYALPALLASVSDYFAGFFVWKFDPQSEQDVIALCHRDNQGIQVRGYDNAKLYFQRPHSPRHTTACLRRFNRVVKIDRDAELVDVQSGANFGELLPELESEGLWVENYPNYHFISVGACLATAVHGSNLNKPFLADLVESIRYYDRERDEVVETRRGEEAFADLIFSQDCPHGRVILSAQLQVCPRQYYELTTERQPIASLNFDNAASFADRGQHYEVRINTPMSRDAFLQSYRQISAAEVEAAPAGSDLKLLPIKADAIGRKWNLLQSNPLMSLLTSAASRWFINYEWFFTPEEFARFWNEVSSDRSRYRLYKLLVRYNRRQPDLNTPYHGTVSIDVTIFHTRSMLELSAELFERYRPLEHLGKYSIQRYINRSDDRRTVAMRADDEDRKVQPIVAD